MAVTCSTEAVSCIDDAVNIFCEIGRLSMAARYLKEIADLYESEQNIEQAVVYYEKSADIFENEESTTTANQCKQKVAQYSAQLEHKLPFLCITCCDGLIPFIPPSTSSQV
ncbi:hypothetical protein RJT34_11312 [Clitoria ternatea]|uniref:Uncharacterized protein n=1 Tax=Clitoria ternatea TaxID=43366 RepID=A0AAN9PJJ8_CLITE